MLCFKKTIKYFILVVFFLATYLSTAEAIIKLIKDENLRTKLGERGNVFARKFSWDLSVERFEDCIAGILN